MLDEKYRSFLCALLIASGFCLLVSLDTARAEDPVLTECVLQLTTSSDGKDDNTVLEGAFCRDGGQEISKRTWYPNEEFGKKSVKWWRFDPFSGPVPTTKEIKGCHVKFYISPKDINLNNGRDTWKFDMIIHLKFSDGTKRRHDIAVITMGENSRNQTWYLPEFSQLKPE